MRSRVAATAAAILIASSATVQAEPDTCYEWHRAAVRNYAALLETDTKMSRAVRDLFKIQLEMKGPVTLTPATRKHLNNVVAGLDIAILQQDSMKRQIEVIQKACPGQR